MERVLPSKRSSVLLPWQAHDPRPSRPAVFQLRDGEECACFCASRAISSSPDRKSRRAMHVASSVHRLRPFHRRGTFARALFFPCGTTCTSRDPTTAFPPSSDLFFSRLESLPRGLSFFFSSSSISPPPSEIPFAFYFFRSFLRPSGSSTGRFRLEPTVDSLSFSFRKGDRFQSKGRRFLSSLPIRPVGNGMEVPRAT